MRIAILALNFASGERHSHEAHLPQLVKALTELDGPSEYLLLLRADNECSFPAASPRIRRIVFPRLLRNQLVRIFCEQVLVPILLVLFQIDLLHFPTNVRPLFISCRSVGTIHWVLTPLLLNAFSWPKRLYSSFFERMSLRKADRLIAVSEACRAGLVESGVPSEKIEVVPHGISGTYARRADPEVLERHGIRPGYLLYVGTSAEYKNLPVLLAAYGQARRSGRIASQLVLVGEVDPEILARFSEEQGAASSWWTRDIVRVGYVSYTNVPTFYSAAGLFVSLSLQESFGVVLLEAMVTGVPMVVSSIPAYVEVADNCALFVNPFSADEACNAIVRLYTNDQLRTALIECGGIRAREFGWRRAAEATLKVYKLAFGSSEQGEAASA